jgi:hypothetical protein
MTKTKPTPRKLFWKTMLKSAATARQRARAPSSLSSRCVSCTDPETDRRERLETGMTRIERGAGDLHGRDQIGCTYLDDPLREVTVGHWIGVGRGLPLLRSGGVGGFWIFLMIIRQMNRVKYFPLFFYVKCTGWRDCHAGRQAPYHIIAVTPC